MFYFYFPFPRCLRETHQFLGTLPLETPSHGRHGMPLTNSTATAKGALAVPHQLIRKLEVTERRLRQHRMFWQSCCGKAVWGPLLGLLASGRGLGLRLRVEVCKQSLSTHHTINQYSDVCMRSTYPGVPGEQYWCGLCPGEAWVKLVREWFLRGINSNNGCEEKALGR